MCKCLNNFLWLLLTIRKFKRQNNHNNSDKITTRRCQSLRTSYYCMKIIKHENALIIYWFHLSFIYSFIQLFINSMKYESMNPMLYTIANEWLTYLLLFNRIITTQSRSTNRRLFNFFSFLFVESSAVSFSHMKKFKHITCSEQYTCEYI